MALLPPPPSNIPPAPVPTAVDLIYQNLRPIRSLRDYDNYVTQNQFSAQASFQSILSLDFVKIFIPPSLANSVQVANSLCSLGCPRYLINNQKGRFSVFYNGATFDIYFRYFFVTRYYLGCSIKIFAPSHAVLCHLDSVLSSQYLVSEIEFTVDLYSHDPGDLFLLIKSTVMMPWAGLQFLHTYQTCYLNNIRKNRSKGARVYLKEINGRVAVRLEVIFKRKMLKKSRHTSLTTLNRIHAEKVFRILRFKQLKTNTIRNKYKKLFLNDICGEEIEARFFASLFRVELTKVFRVNIFSALNYLYKIIGRGEYLDSHPFQKVFMSAVHGKKFIS